MNSRSKKGLWIALGILCIALVAFMIYAIPRIYNSGSQTSQEITDETSTASTEELPSTDSTQADTDESTSMRAPTGVSMSATKDSPSLEIKRAAPGAKRPQGIVEDSWTIFVYLCGSNLETEAASATKDLDEMLKGNGAQNIKFVVETGGAKAWRNNTMDARQLGRYVVEQGQLKNVGAVQASNMGEAATLSDFLSWGIKNYPADHMALILWDHGGGSISGVCFDERNSNDSLSLRELDTALNQAFGLMWDKFEFVGFDACLMSTLETANVVASYANYMVASQESEPGNGWEYTSIVRYLSENPGCTGSELGQAICKSYHASVERNMKGFVTLSVVDLSKIDQLIQDFYAFSQEMYDSASDQATLAAMSRNIQKADNYGANNRREGFTNMVDLGGLVEACGNATPSAPKVSASLQDAVTYQVHGTFHEGATGLSTYYPLQINNSRELAIFQTVAVNPSYVSYVDRLAHGATYNGGTQYQQYSSDSVWNGNFWEWLLGNASQAQSEAQSHWNYVEEHDGTSTQITFAQEPQIDDEGTFWFQLDQGGINNTTIVSGMIYQRAENGTDLIALGETYDVWANWESGEFADGFDGKWLSLPDGQNLNLVVQSSTDSYIIYTAPIELNGVECYLRLRQDIASGEVEVEGVWNAINESGALDRGYVELKRGDVIVPLYKAITLVDGKPAKDYEGDSFTLDADTLSIGYDYLPEGYYLYNFLLEDCFGDIYATPSAQFEVDETGAIYF